MGAAGRRGTRRPLSLDAPRVRPCPGVEREGPRFGCFDVGLLPLGPGAVFSEEEGVPSEFLGTLGFQAPPSRVVEAPASAERSNGHRVFYDAGSARCLIYAVRPEQCRSFLWPEPSSRARRGRRSPLLSGHESRPLRSAAEIEEWTRSA